jgi:hypothetical protein
LLRSAAAFDYERLRAVNRERERRAMRSYKWEPMKKGQLGGEGTRDYDDGDSNERQTGDRPFQRKRDGSSS